MSIQLPLQTYPVYLGSSLLSEKALFARHIRGKQVMIVTQKKIADLYLKDLLATLSAYRCDLSLLPQGEQYKNLRSWSKVLDRLVAKGHERSTTLLALGGGLVGDVTGFAAACYQRGVGYIHLPTTLLAQVDSAIGGKTGVNHVAGKNLIGAFYHPLCVLIDFACLKTLPRREWLAGLAEIIKCSLIRDQNFFSWLENNMAALIQGQEEALLHAVYTAISIKSNLIAQDEREQSGLRSLLNFGHTLGHALESLFHYRRYLHGEAVAIGMNMAARLSLAKGWLLEKDYKRIHNLLLASHLPTEINKKIDEKKLFSYLQRDKKNANQQIQWVLLKSIGEAVLTAQVSKAAWIKSLPRC